MSREELSHEEKLRRFRLGQLRKVLRDRYGVPLPDDDAGRDELKLQLRMSLEWNWRGIIKAWAPWMSQEDARRLIAKLKAIPEAGRVLNHKQLGRALRLTDEERTLLEVYTIRPCDLSEKQFQERRAMKKQQFEIGKRRAVGVKPRSEYLAQFKNSARKKKPWLKLDIAESTYYDRRKRLKEREAALETHDSGYAATPGNGRSGCNAGAGVGTLQRSGRSAPLNALDENRSGCEDDKSSTAYCPQTHSDKIIVFPKSNRKR